MNFLRNAILGDSSSNGNGSIQRKNSGNKNRNIHQRRNYQDDYFSDDDDWGMTAFRPTKSSLQKYGYATHDVGDSENSGSGRREMFWDQSTVNSDQPGKKKPGGDKNSGEMQSWEKASMYQDQLDNAFSIGDDDYYNSDQRSLEEDKKAYDEVQEDLRTVEDSAEEESVKSNQEDVANAYRDYLKSIREGGFETYLNAEDENETPDFDNMAFGDDSKQTPTVTNSKRSNNGRVLEIEEDRELYGGLYGVRDMRAQDSPYTSWRAKAQALVDYDNERQRGNTPSPLRAGINRFRRKSPTNVDSGRDFEEEMMTRRGHYNYPLLHSGRFKRFCFCSVIMFAIAVGLYNSVYHQSDQESLQTSVPPKTGSSPESSQPKEDPNLYVPPSASNAIINTLKTFDPVWFDRRSGWEGITFKDAVNFCKSKDKRVPCSYELYCEDGPGLPPYEGVKTNGEQWAAISNGPNQWVQVGTIANDPTHTCKTYKQLHGELPRWGVTGISTEHIHGAGGITQNLMCCVNANHLPADWWYFDDEMDAEQAGEPTEEVEAVEEAVAQDNTAPEMTETPAVQDTAQVSNDPNEGNAAVVSDNIKIQQREKAVIAAFQPIWFASSHGWDGTTYDAAVDFCESYDHMVLCPFSAYCPNGPGTPPLSGSMVLEIDGEQWAPVNGPPNSWVQLGTVSGEPNSRCALYHDLLGNRPQWGLDGSKPELKRHVMCCLM